MGNKPKEKSLSSALIDEFGNGARPEEFEFRNLQMPILQLSIFIYLSIYLAVWRFL